MIRTQVSLNKNEYQQVVKEARKLGISIAEYFRILVRDSLPRDSSKPWMKYCGFVESGDPNSSNRIDELVYGTKD